MCSVVILRQPGSPWPVLLAGNRDEMADRPWQPPGRHWPDRPNVVAGRDILADWSWLGVNDEGVLAVILNRFGTLGPAAGKRSRGELVLDALDHADAADAAEALRHLDTRAYRPFNMIVADNRDAFVIYHRGDAGGEPGPGGVATNRPVVSAVSVGVHMLTAFDLDQSTDPRIDHFRPLFADAPIPAPDNVGSWTAWQQLLAARDPGGERESSAMNFLLSNGFGTVSSSLIALPAIGRNDVAPIWRFCPGRPDEAAWVDVTLRETASQ